MRVVREEARLSERRACGLMGMHRGSWRYRRKERNEAALRARLRELAGERPRFGYRRLCIFLRREKAADGTLRWWVNHKRVYRLYREEGLAMQRKRRKRFRAEARVPLALTTKPQARANGRWIEMLFGGPCAQRLLAVYEKLLVSEKVALSTPRVSSATLSLRRARVHVCLGVFILREKPK